ncbi:MAG: hypothetical protein WAU36_04205 [Cyclobacteriaceae bacterium]
MKEENEAPSSEESIGQLLYDRLFGHAQLKEILNGQTLDDFVEERVDIYYMELNADLSCGVSYQQAKSHALKALLKGV